MASSSNADSRLLTRFGEFATELSGPQGGLGKLTGRLTLGERVQVLERLDSFLAQAVGGLVPLSGSRVMGTKGVKLLHRLSKDRNRLAHELGNLQSSEVTELLARASDLCESPLIQCVIALQQKRYSAPPCAQGGHRP